MSYLEIRIAQEVRRISLDRRYLRIGRLAENDVVLRDAQISRQHAELRLASGQWRILDLGSTNGLHVKGKRVREHHLENGDVVLLAPNIMVCFRDGVAPPDAILASAANGADAPYSPQPSVGPPPVTASAPPIESPMFDALRPRSPFADDEQPYFPGGIGMPAPPTQYNRQYTPGAATPNDGQWYVGESSDANSAQFDTIPAGGYPAPAGPMTSGSDGQDPFRRSGGNLNAEANRATAGPTSTLLHVCQTCGQLTAPDSVYCQSCHQSVAHECANCRLSLLPIQDRCPRCHTPNPGSVRRAHRASSA